ncbi:bile acid:sodium symporter family protein [Luteolibacter marinus]|uniref:bile acid:sodium symporter family protein n=1 Tax=Luteolibacter marinus TaxID=2776705 RepID=UPI0018688D0C|nr:bile acid:sodium symporter [Luteolibacter marinus]
MSPAFLSHLLDLGIALVTLALMAGVGLALDPRGLPRALRPPGPLAVQLAAVVLLPPLLGLSTVWLLDPPPAVAAGILLLAACPVGDIANVYTLLAGANPARSLVINILTAVAAPLTMTAIIAGYHACGRSETYLAVPPGPLFVRLMLLLALPVSAGLLLRRHRPAFAAKAGKAIHRFTGIGILLLVALVLLSPAFRIDHYLPAVITAATFLLLSLVPAALLAVRTPDRDDGVAAALCLPVRNVGVAALIAISLLRRNELTAVVAVYFVIEVPLMWGVARAISSRRAGRNLAESSSSV